jgi:hypothetical protein
MANDDVAKRTDEQQSMVSRSEMERTLMGGTAAMRAAGKRYLPKEPAETEDAYNCRRDRTFLFNAFGKTVGDMTGKVFAKPVILKDDVPKQLQDYAENIDLTGRHINVFARDVFHDAMQTGICYILTDMPPKVEGPNGGPASQAQEAAAGQRPYLTHITLENLLGYRSETINGAERLTQIRIMECVKVSDGEFNEVTVAQVRVIDAGRNGGTAMWRTFRKMKTADGKEEWQQYESGSTTLPDITLAVVYTNRTEFMQAEPPLEKLAEKNIEHWQSASDQKNILHVARVPILFGAGFKEGDSFTVGANSMVRVSDPNAKLEYVEHTGAAIDAGDKDLQNIEQQMQAMGLQLLVDAKGPQTATGEVRDDAKENSPLAMMADALADALEASLGFMARYMGLGDDAGGEVQVNKDFGVQSGRTDLQQLAAVRAQGDLSRETLWEEMQRRDFLSDSFDPDVEKDRLANEPQPMMDLGGSAPSGGVNGSAAGNTP